MKEIILITKYEVTKNTNLYINKIKSDFISVTVKFRAGRLHTPKDKFEMAHLMEHLALTGSAKFKNKEELTNFCESNQIYVNAFTGDEYISYIMRGNFESIQKIIDLLFAMAFSPNYTLQNVKEQKKIVTQELQNNLSDPFRRNFSNISSGIYSNEMNLTERIKTLQNISLSDINKYHKLTHTALNCSIVVNGDISTKQASIINSLCSKQLEKVTLGNSISRTKLVLNKFKNKIILDSQLPLKSINVIFWVIFPKLEITEYAEFRLRVGAILTGIGSTVTLKARSAGYIYGQGAGLAQYHGQTILRVNTSIRNENLLPYFELLSEEYEKIMKNILPEELERSRGVQLMNEKALETNMLDPIQGSNRTVDRIEEQDSKSLSEILQNRAKNFQTPKANTWCLSLVGEITLNQKTLDKLEEVVDNTFR